MAWSLLARAAAGAAAGSASSDITGTILGPTTTSIGYGNWALFPIKIPTPTEVMGLYRLGLLDFPSYRAGMIAQGHDVKVPLRRYRSLEWKGLRYGVKDERAPEPWTAADLIQASHEWTPPLVLAMEIWNRDWVGNDTFEHWLRKMEITDPEMVRILKAMTTYVPPPQDLIRFVVREVFDDELRRQLQLDSDIKDDSPYWQWASASGLREVEIPDGKGGFLKRNFAKDYWAAHWQHVSPTQAYEMYHRLRPGRLGRLPAELRDVKPFLLEDLRRLLRVQDFAPGWRDRLAAISFRTVGRLDARRIYRAGIVDRAELTEMFKDFGYGPDDAEKLAGYEEWSLQNAITIPQLTGMLRRRIITADQYRERIVRRGYTLDDAGRMQQLTERVPTVQQWTRWVRKGLAAPADAVEAIENAGFSRANAERYVREAQRARQLAVSGPRVSRVLEAMLHGVVGEAEARRLLARLGLPDDEIQAAVSDELLRERIARVRKAQARVRRQYLTGAVNRPAAEAALDALGMARGEVQRFLTLWDSEFGLARKELSAQQTVDLLKRGIINVAEGSRRLANLGYDSRTQQILLLAGEQDRQQAVARAAIAASRTAKEQEQAALSAMRRAEQQGEKARRALASHGSPTTLQRWLKRGLITPREVYNRLRALGWPQIDARRLIEEARAGVPPEEVAAAGAEAGEAEPQAPREGTGPPAPRV